MSEVEEQVQTEESQLESNGAFLPGELFYTERIDLPVGITSAELETAIEMQIEANAPFPLDQLNFGAVIDRIHHQALVYASFKDQLSVDAEEDLKTPKFPGFLPFVGFQAQRPCLLRGISENQISILVFDQVGCFPREIHSLAFAGDPTDATVIAKLSADFLRDLPWLKLPLEDRFFTWKETSRNWKNETHFVSKDAEGETLIYQLNPFEASFADVRDRELKQKALKTARWNNILWFTTLGSICGILLMIGLFLLNWGWSFSIEKRENQIAERQSKVESIESKERNLQVFESGSAAQLQPLSMLDIVNRVRPDGVYFSEVKAYEGDQLQIDGMAEKDGAELINRFRDSLKQLKDLESVSVEITRINQGVAYFFRANLKFRELELANVGAQS